MKRSVSLVIALVAFGGCGGIEIDFPEIDTGVDLDGGWEVGADLDAGELGDGHSSDPVEGDADDGDDGSEVDDGSEIGDEVTTAAETSDGGSEVDDGSDHDGGDDGPWGGECCASHDTPGCDNATTAGCVCEIDSFCCEVEWDEICVAEVDQLGCGLCDGHDDGNDDVGDEIGDDESASDVTTDDGGDDDDGDSGNNTGPCCESHETAGCEYLEVAACVCEQDPFCCEVQWDELCVAEVDMIGCGVCGGVSTDGGTDPSTDGGGNDEAGTDPSTGDGGSDDGANTSACCEAHDTPGCEYLEVADCVCASDAFCCEAAWDEICVDEVSSLGCGVC